MRTRPRLLRWFVSLNIVLFLALAAVLSGCSGSSVPDRAQAPQAPLVWPAPPEPARISYVQKIENPKDIGASKGIFSRLVELVVGGRYDAMVKPFGMAIDSKGRLLVADTSLKRVHVYDMERKKYSYIEKAGKTTLVSPISVAVDSKDNIYVTDSILARVVVFGPDAKYVRDFEAGERPTGIAVDAAGKKLYVADTKTHKIGVYGLDGSEMATIGKWGSDPGEFNYPVDVYVDKKGDLYVVDSMNYRVQIFGRDGKFQTSFGQHGDGTGDFGRPKGVTVDVAGNIYVTDALFDTVQIFDREGNFLLSFGSLGRTPGNFWLPTGVYAGSGNKIYVADSYNKRVQVFEYLGGGSGDAS